ncbi:MAG: hypothetical protein ACHQM6_04895 [Candidatus Kapaibacterium sp.]
MKRILTVSFILAIFVTSSFAKKDPSPKTWSGYLMDKMCSKRMIGNHDKIVKHSKTCLTEEECSSSGYGLMTDKKFIPFDAKGNEIAANYIKGSSKESDFQIEVTGSLKKNKLAVSDLKEAKAQN